MRQDDEYNERQYNRMLQVIERYETGRATIATLIDDLYALIRALENVSPDWRRLLVSRWAPLEEVYAMALYRREGRLSEDDREDIASALRDLRDTLKNRGPETNSRLN
jgi:hypothetical protein